MSKLNITKSGTYWEGGPMKLTEPPARNVTTKAFDSFVFNLRDAIQKTKDEVDTTLADARLNKSIDMRNKQVSDTKITDLDTIVDEKIAEIEQTQHEEKLKEYLKLQYQAASHIVELKAKMKETEEVNDELKTQIENQNDTLLQTVTNLENEKTEELKRHNITMSNRIKMTKLISMNPPPKFENYTAFGTANGLLSFLNENLEDYFEDICMTDKEEKCRILVKIYGEKCENYKYTTKRFFMQENVHTLMMNDDVTIRMIYKELVHFIFATKPKGDVGPRREGESLTNYLTRWFTIKEYCGISSYNQGSSILKKIFERPELLRCKEEVIRELKAKFFVPYANDEKISKESLIGYANRLDMLYSTENNLGIHAIASYNEPMVKRTGMIALDNRKEEKSTAELEKKIEMLMNTVQKNHQDRNMNQQNQTQYRNKPPGINNTCFNCGDPSHFAKDCPQRRNNNNYNNHNNQNNFRQNNSNPPKCFECGKPGHFARNCSMKRTQTNNWVQNNQRQNNGYRGHYNNQNYNNNYNNNGQKRWNNNKFDVKPWQQQINQVQCMNIDLNSLCAMNQNGDIREYVETTLKLGVTVKSLLDTGAMVNAISLDLIEQCSWKNQLDTSKSGNIELADKKTATCAGIINTPIEINGTHYDVEFRVIANLNPRIIYGAPFLNDTGILEEFRYSVNNRLNTNTQSKN